MPGQTPRAATAASAAALALITMLVFWVLRDYGPESAIRRFHEGVANNDVIAVQQVLEEPVNNPDAQELESRVVALENAHADYRILRMDRETTRVAAELLYTLPDGLRIRTVWIVVKRNKTWRVLAAETGRSYHRMEYNSRG